MSFASIPARSAIVNFMKTVLFVPGFKEGMNTRDYQSTLRAIADKNYGVKFVSINWQRTFLRDWTRELDVVYEKHDPKNTILAGFSFGSLTAFMSATKRNPSELWLFSFSPYFSDDIPKMKKAWLASIGHRRVDDFKKLHFSDLAPLIRCKTKIFIGEIEAKKYPLLKQRAITAQKLLADSKLFTVPGSDHDVTNKNYIQAIMHAI